MKYGVRVKKIYKEDKVLQNALLVVEGDLIKDILENGAEDEIDDLDEIFDLSKYNLIPGLIDIHIHGGDGYDVMDSSFEAINGISKYLVKRGITAFLPTIITETPSNIKRALKNINSSIGKVQGAEILGIYVEGPYITKEHKGAHPENLIKDLDLDEIKNFIKASEDNIRVITIAPEKKLALKCIKYLKENNIEISMGHTSATFNQAVDAVEGGAHIAVHTFNGMRGLNHREPAILGAVLTKDEVYCELIGDLIHVHPTAIDILLRCKPKDKVILISDCMRAGGLEDGEYMLGTLKTIVKDSIARTEDGSLAGSTTNILASIKNMINKVGVNPIEAINMGSINPAKLLKVNKYIGSIEKNKKANFVIVDDDFNVIKTLINGQIVYKN